MFPNMLTTDYANAIHAARLEAFTATQTVRRGRADRPASTHGVSGLRIGVARLLAALTPAARRSGTPPVESLSSAEATPAG